MTRTKRALASLAVGGAMAAVPAAPALAQGPAVSGPIVTGGLVNVTVTDLLNNDTILSNNNVAVGAAVQIAANVCGVAVNVLATQLGTSGPIDCTNPTGALGVSITQL